METFKKSQKSALSKKKRNILDEKDDYKSDVYNICL